MQFTTVPSSAGKDSSPYLQEWGLDRVGTRRDERAVRLPLRREGRGGQGGEWRRTGRCRRRMMLAV